ncbi:MAG TPA: hypothetical protein VKZ18_01835 [Polyangia bacterium]|nr:hypothetical protein [Polyangia bacterium]
MSAEGDPEDTPADPQPTGKLSKLGKFIQTYHSFLSSFVIGVAGLVATSIWQYRQSQIAAQQARSEQAIAQTKAENDWRIARAEILSKNLNVLSAQGPGSADQRFGVLLSLTRGAIIDPELAVSYAMELGKDNPTYMRTVLEATGQKNYQQLAQGFKLTCTQRFGVQRATDICKDDVLAERSDAIAQVISDEMDATAAVHGPAAAGPMAILREEREVQAAPGKMEWLFDPYLEDLYERRVWQEIQRFEDFSTGAHLVASLALSTARTGEMVSSAEASTIEKFHADHRRWLGGYLLGATCGGDCRGKLVNAMLSGYLQAQGDYDEPFRRILVQPRAEAASAFAHLHTRLLWCQVDPDAVAQFRDRVLVPAFNDAYPDPGKPPAKTLAAAVEDLVDLLALVPEPPATDAAATAAWKKIITTLDKSSEHLARTYNARRAASSRERAAPPPMIRKVNFCGAPAMPDTSAGAKP